MANDPKSPDAEDTKDTTDLYQLTPADAVKVCTEIGCRLKVDFSDEPDPAKREVIVVTDTNREIKFPVSAIKARSQDEALRQLKSKIQKS